ncbi:hypothetical protein DK419_02565 [Methylobacterium terrae]|uniref:Uncharacterized protein n=1 Tax=Methylobacterium terrae TaxID=2202827 RepID=A0A2U8WIJ4_9HYPH|nr:hypothetical protein DK419_02565 [Methylobacterium terrae]
MPASSASSACCTATASATVLRITDTAAPARAAARARTAIYPRMGDQWRGPDRDLLAPPAGLDLRRSRLGARERRVGRLEGERETRRLLAEEGRARRAAEGG